jgi:hypothetical protein
MRHHGRRPKPRPGTGKSAFADWSRTAVGRAGPNPLAPIGVKLRRGTSFAHTVSRFHTPPATEVAAYVFGEAGLRGLAVRREPA